MGGFWVSLNYPILHFKKTVCLKNDWMRHCRGYLPLIRKDSITRMHGLTVYVNGGLPFARDIPPKNSADAYLRFRLSLLHSVSYFFFLYRSPSSFLYTVFDVISVSGQALLESLWFSTACAAVTVHKNPIFCLYQQNKSSESKVKRRQAANRYRRVFKATKLAYAEKTKQKSIKSL